MANTLTAIQKDEIRLAFLEIGSIREVAKRCACSRNTVRRLLRSEGLAIATMEKEEEPNVAPSLDAVDFIVLDKLFEAGRGNGENLSFEQHIKRITQSIAAEIGISGVTDQLRLESAMLQYICHRRFYFKSLTASDSSYSGPFQKAHEKHARAVRDWVEISQKALDHWNKLIRELEIKYGKRVPNYGRGNVFVQANIQNNR